MSKFKVVENEKCLKENVYNGIQPTWLINVANINT